MHQNRISQISYRFRILFQILLYLTPIMVIMNWSHYDLWLEFANIDPNPFNTSIHSLSFSSRIGAILISMVPAGMWMLALYLLSKLFRLYEQNQIFTELNVLYIKKIGYALFAEVVTRCLLEPVLSLVVTMNNPPGERMIMLSFGSPDFSKLVFSGIVILIAWIMQEGQKLKEDSDLII